jgi:hypothetical protein
LATGRAAQSEAGAFGGDIKFRHEFRRWPFTLRVPGGAGGDAAMTRWRVRLGRIPAVGCGGRRRSGPRRPISPVARSGRSSSCVPRRLIARACWPSCRCRRQCMAAGWAVPRTDFQTALFASVRWRRRGDADVVITVFPSGAGRWAQFVPIGHSTQPLQRPHWSAGTMLRDGRRRGRPAATILPGTRVRAVRVAVIQPAVPGTWMSRSRSTKGLRPSSTGRVTGSSPWRRRVAQRIRARARGPF